MTATVVMQLAQQQRLAQTDPVTRWLPMLAPTWDRIQVRHLLSHSSGIPEYFYNKPKAEVDGITNTQIIQRLADNPILNFEPGTRAAYSNTNYLLLAEVAAVASGQNFAGLLRNGIFEPCGMELSWLKGETPPVSSVLALNQAESPLIAGVDLLSVGAFGVKSTVDDLARFMAAYKQGRLVGADTMRQMTIAQSSGPVNSLGEYYGFGWYVPGPITVPAIYAHTGGAGGYVGLLRTDLGHSLEVIALSNSGSVGDAQIDRIRGVLDTYYPVP